MAKGKLTQRQMSALERHSEHHTKKHMSSMKKMMLDGKTFGEAHKAALRKVGQ